MRDTGGKAGGGIEEVTLYYEHQWIASDCSLAGAGALSEEGMDVARWHVTFDIALLSLL